MNRLRRANTLTTIDDSTSSESETESETEMDQFSHPYTTGPSGAMNFLDASGHMRPYFANTKPLSQETAQTASSRQRQHHHNPDGNISHIVNGGNNTTHNYGGVGKIDNRVSNVTDNSMHKYGTVGKVDNSVNKYNNVRNLNQSRHIYSDVDTINDQAQNFMNKKKTQKARAVYQDQMTDKSEQTNRMVNKIGRTPTPIDNAVTANNPEVEALISFTQRWQLQPPVAVFTGRDSELSEMKQYFEIETTNSATQSLGAGNVSQRRKVFVIYGLGGSGKTQLALKFAERYANYFESVFFFDASSEKTLDDELSNAAKRLKIGDTAKETLAWLISLQNWLIIFDNAGAEDPNLNLSQKYFPSGSHGNILITTRNTRLTAYAPQSFIHMPDLSPNEAADLLLKALGQQKPYDGTTIQSASSLAEDLCYFPLAIMQAAEYIQNNYTSIKDYLELFKERRKDLFGNPNYETQNTFGHYYPFSVYATWNISYERLSDSAKDFLSLCAFLPKEKMQRTPFEKGISRLLGCKGSGSDLQARLQAHWTNKGKWDIIKFNETIKQLAWYSFVTASNNGSQYSLHPLVRLWVQDKLDIQTSKAIDTTLGKLGLVSESQVDSTSYYRFWRQLMLFFLNLFYKFIR